MVWEGPETFPLFLRVPGALFLQLVSLHLLPASILVALAPKHINMGVKFNAFITPNLTRSTSAKETSLMTTGRFGRGSPKGVCLPVQGLLLSSTYPFPPPQPFVERQAKFPLTLPTAGLLPLRPPQDLRFYLRSADHQDFCCAQTGKGIMVHTILPFQDTVYMQGATCKTAFHALNLSDHPPPVPRGVIPPFQ